MRGSGAGREGRFSSRRRSAAVVVWLAVAALAVAAPPAGPRAVLARAAALPASTAAQHPAGGDLAADGLEAVVETSKGEFVFRFLPAAAPLHVAAFIETARRGGYDGTSFQLAYPNTLVQGGEAVAGPSTKPAAKPSTRPAAKPPAKPAPAPPSPPTATAPAAAPIPDEPNAVKQQTGTVSAASRLDASGVPIPNTSSQGFVVDDAFIPTRDGKLTAFGYVTRGQDTVRAISLVGSSVGKMSEAVTIRRVTIRPATPTVEEMRRMRVHVETGAGEIVFDLLPDAAPENARHFVNLAREGYYDGLSFYRAIPGFVLQGGNLKGYAPDSPNARRSFSVWPVVDEFTTATMDRGLVGMAHGAEANGATVHFFVLLSRAPGLDNKYTAFGRVVSGMDVAEAIVKGPVTGELLNAPVTITRIRIDENGGGGDAAAASPDATQKP